MSPTPRRGSPAVASLLLVPVAALLASVYLPFVNNAGLVLGLPRLFLWTSFWVVAITPLLLLVERGRRDDDTDDDADIEADGTGAEPTEGASR
ncbi:hypothetical protein ACFJIY_23480 [Pimelobacter simplex]|uniref:hypothetical protein n=1 Tax=Nocardioides simplex TaxID=2045 RepID=UPI00366C1FC3